MDGGDSATCENGTGQFRGRIVGLGGELASGSRLCVEIRGYRSLVILRYAEKCR